ncbi:hypothetical protein AA313_de0205583 [Arthrobotrys entomopaga]|nr:hypothetical protein AA313_de0205583 [Arthrobotrys entomopaga]
MKDERGITTAQGFLPLTFAGNLSMQGKYFEENMVTSQTIRPFRAKTYDEIQSPAGKPTGSTAAIHHSGVYIPSNSDNRTNATELSLENPFSIGSTNKKVFLTSMLKFVRDPVPESISPLKIHHRPARVPGSVPRGSDSQNLHRGHRDSLADTSSRQATASYLHRTLTSPSANNTQGGLSDILGRFTRLESDDEIKLRYHMAHTFQKQRYLLQLCKALMLYGAPTHRLEEYLKMSARILDVEGQFLYLPGCMILSFDNSSTHTSNMQLVRVTQALDLGRLQDIHLVYKQVVHDIISVEEGMEKLEMLFKQDSRFAPCLNILNQCKWKQLPVSLSISVTGFAVNFFAARRFPTNIQIANALGAFSIGIAGNMYSRVSHQIAFTSIVPAILIQVPSGLAAQGGLITGLDSADSLTNKTLTTSPQNQFNSAVANVALGMIQVWIGISVGLFFAAIAVYPVGNPKFLSKSLKLINVAFYSLENDGQDCLHFRVLADYHTRSLDPRILDVT